MRIVDFGPTVARPIEDFGAEGCERVTVAPLTSPLWSGVPLQAACFRLDAGGRIGRHPATLPQLLAVVEGTGWVSGADGEPHAIGPEQAAFWEAGEEHETWTHDGLTAVVIESERLLPYEPRPLS